MSTRADIDRVRVLLARVDEVKKALEKFDNVEIPTRRDALIRRVEASRGELVSVVAKPEVKPEIPALVAAMKNLRFALPDAQPIVFCPRTPPLATSEPVVRTTRCRAGCRLGNHSLAVSLNFARFGLKLRVQLVRSDGPCYRCLESGHIANACPRWAVQCGHLTRNGEPCQTAHHILLNGVILDEIYRR